MGKQILGDFILRYYNTEIIHETPVYRLHHAKGNGNPCLIVPPHAGRHGCVTQNLLDCTREHRNTFVFDLISANQQTKHVSIGDLCTCIDDCINLIGASVDLVGVCQGGWLSAIYNALHPDKVNSLALMAAPIDIQAAPDNEIAKACREIPVEYFRAAVCASEGIQPGISQWIAFAMSNPVEVFFSRWSRLMWAILFEDTELVEKLQKNNKWYDSPQDLAGAWYLQAMEDLFFGNKLISGTMVVAGKNIVLSELNGPVFLYAGESDMITAPEQLFGISKALKKPAKEFLLPKAGHTKVFTGKEELKIFADSFLS